MNSNEQDFFNSLANDWDKSRSLDTNKLERLIALCSIKDGDKVLDVGTGTGVLIPYLYDAVGRHGTITALDYAENMVLKAAEKYSSLSGVTYLVADIMKFQPSTRYTKVVCLNFFPHIKDKPAFLIKMKELLLPGGTLVIMHDISRGAVNAIHQTSNVVKDDRLPPSAVVAQMLHDTGYLIDMAMDDDEQFFVKGIIEGAVE